MPRPKSPCGTYAAYQRHLREKSPVCAACRKASQDRNRQRSNSAAARAERAAPSAPVVPIVPPAPTTEDGHVSRVEVLREMLQQSRETIAALKGSDPTRLYLLMREQRETLREISEIQGNGQVKGVTLADQLAAARAERAANS